MNKNLLDDQALLNMLIEEELEREQHSTYHGYLVSYLRTLFNKYCHPENWKDTYFAYVPPSETSPFIVAVEYFHGHRPEPIAQYLASLSRKNDAELYKHLWFMKGYLK